MSSQNPYNSKLQHVFVDCYRTIARHVDLQRGFVGWIYQQAYFAYKNVIDRKLLITAGRLLRPGSLIVDVGANIGFFSIALCRRHKIESLAFEPEPRNFAQLGRTIAAYKLQDRIHCYDCAISDTSGPSRLYISELGSVDHKLLNTRSSRTIDIQTTTLDDFFESQPHYRAMPVALIKIDIQGGELMALTGMKQSLARLGNPPILVEYSASELSSVNDRRRFFDAFADLGYRPHSIPDMRPMSPEHYLQRENRAYTDIAMLASPAPSPT